LKSGSIIKGLRKPTNLPDAKKRKTGRVGDMCGCCLLQQQQARAAMHLVCVHGKWLFVAGMSPHHQPRLASSCPAHMPQLAEV
jgi:hypothetical protein